VFTTLTFGQNADDAPSNALRHPGWNYGAQFSGGSTVVQSTAPRFVTANHSISNVAVLFHVGRVLTSEHGPGWIRGTFEWDVSVIPVEIFWVLGSHYAGGFEALGPRWNFTNDRRRVVPYAGLTGGMLLSPRNFPPGDTLQMNFTAAIDVGAHLFHRHQRSIDIGTRVQHVSNAYLGRLNPGVPLSLQVTLGYSWY
jgi:Lipid A 3-O-deacylase (PagL)